MGNTLSSWGGQKRVQKLISSSGLPLQIDNSDFDDSKGELSAFTEAYPAPGWFTGVKSAITINKPPSEVYDSLSKDLHHVFTPMSECNDEIEEDDGYGKQAIFRIVRIPFKVAFVTGNLKLRLNVRQDRKDGKIHFESVKEGRLITRFIADFDISSATDGKTSVKLDAKVNCKSVPPAPFKNMVKDVMVRKMDSCMVDLLNFHSDAASDDDEFASAHGDPVEEPDTEDQLASQKPTYNGFLEMVRSLSAPLRHSFEAFDRRRSMERPVNATIQDTAHDNLGHDPSPPEPTARPHSNVAAIASESSLYKPSTDSLSSFHDPIATEKPVSMQAPSQADVFTKWQESRSHLCSPSA